VSALDVSIQAGVINLLDELKVRLGLAYLFVAHEPVPWLRHLADRVAVMYLGKLVEVGSVESVFAAPHHPYTQALLSAIPVPDPVVERRRERILLHGDLPQPGRPAVGLPVSAPAARCSPTLGPLAPAAVRGAGSAPARRRPEARRAPVTRSPVTMRARTGGRVRVASTAHPRYGAGGRIGGPARAVAPRYRHPSGAGGERHQPEAGGGAARRR